MRTAPVSRRPTRLGRVIAAGSATAAAALAAGHGTGPAAVGAAGLGLLLVGLAYGVRRPVTWGAATLLGGLGWAGVEGASAGVLLVGAAGTVLAWDVAGFAVDLGAQLGREADTRRLEARHAAATGTVVSLSAGLGLAVFRSTTGGPPVAALLLLLVAGALLVAALDYA